MFRDEKRKNFSVGAKYKLYFPIQIKRVHADEKNAAKKRSQGLENQKITKNRKYKGIYQKEPNNYSVSQIFFSTGAFETSRGFLGLPVWIWGGQTSTPIFKIALKNYFTSIPSD